MTKRRKVIIACLLIILIASAVYFFFLRNNAKDTAKTTSKSPTAQSDYSGGAERKSNSGNASQGGAKDTQGQDVGEGSDSSISSSSGAITVYQPSKDAVLDTGVILSGKASLDIGKVQYRLIDDNIGVIAQGSLTTNNGNYSGKLQFSTQAASGRLDVFSLDSAGAEINNIEISVRFKE